MQRMIEIGKKIKDRFRFVDISVVDEGLTVMTVTNKRYISREEFETDSVTVFGDDLDEYGEVATYEKLAELLYPVVASTRISQAGPITDRAKRDLSLDIREVMNMTEENSESILYSLKYTKLLTRVNSKYITDDLKLFYNMSKK